jgi:glycosyltransferase involved in cell wall biosynthesis
MVKMRVLHLVKTSNGASWAERQMRELIKLGVEVHAAIPPGGKLISDYIRDGINLHYLSLDFPLKQPWKFLWMKRKLRKIIDEIKPDIVHSHFVVTTLTARLALRNYKIPLLFQLPGPLHLENVVISKLDIYSARKFDYWCASCHWTRLKYLSLGIPFNRVFYVPYVPEIERFSPLKKDQAREIIGLDKDKKIIGMIAYFYSPRILLKYKGIKGHEYLIDAISKCLKKRQDIICLMVGGPFPYDNNKAIKYMENVRIYAKNKCGNKILFLGERHDIPLILSALDVVVVPSLSENYGGTIEALLMEKPVIATAVGGIPEIIVNGETGILIPPKNANILADAILWMLDNEEEGEDMGKQGRIFVEKHFNKNVIAKKLLNIYQTIINSY